MARCRSLKGRRKDLVVADASKTQGSFACPRCKKTLREVTRVPPLQKEDGLIAYECTACSYTTSVIWPAKGQTEI
jgi:transcription elongation factor Elf1